MSEPRIGELRHRLNLEAATRSSDGAGGVSETWDVVAEVWAAIRPLAGAERLDADRLSGRVTHEIWLRHRDGVAPAMRFTWDARVFDIRAVLDQDEHRRWLKCLVEEKDI